MKVALVNIFQERGSTSPLGLISLATYVREYAGFRNIRIIDAAVEDVEQVLKSYRPNAVGISSMTYMYNYAIKLSAQIKTSFDISVFVGGPHISSLPYNLSPTFDFGIVGEGEQTFLEVLQALESGAGLTDIPGLVYWNHKELKRSTDRMPINPLDRIPIPDRDYASPKYFEPLKNWDGRLLVEGNLLTSRGCPYRCPFCSTSRLWHKFRLHSVARIIEEIQYLRDRYHVTCINIWDDFFTFSKRRVREVVQAIHENKLNEDIEYRVQVRVNTFDEEMARLLKSMNVSNLNFGFESGSPRMLAYLKQKTVTVDQIKRAIILGKRYDMLVTGSLIFGSPGETLEDMRLTLKLMDRMRQLGADYIWFFVATPYPATEFWDIALKRGVVHERAMDWSLLDLRQYSNPLLLDSSITRKQFAKVISTANYKAHAFRIKAKNRPLTQKIRWALRNPWAAFRTLVEYVKL